uniref:Ribonuclease A-domain domain-containing protein n=1 Tax=Ailuropoda melanoleuca TaxID=9646 RepID=A0A7N5P3F2_AILME
MMLGLLGPFPLLLLLLGSWGPVHPLGASAQPRTRAQWFAIQHISGGPVQCNNAMRRVNNNNQRCKPQNTFLHTTFPIEERRGVGELQGQENGQNNCHRSARRIGMTYCNLTGGRFPNCRYRTTPQNRFYTVACNRRQPGDPPYRLVPVHLD